MKVKKSNNNKSTSKNKANKSKSSKSSAVSKAKTSASVKRAGRPAIELPIPMDGRKFTINSIMSQVGKRKNGKVTRVTIGVRINKLLSEKKIQMVEKKQGERGQPTRVYSAIGKSIKKPAATVKKAKLQPPVEPQIPAENEADKKQQAEQELLAVA